MIPRSMIAFVALIAMLFACVQSAPAPKDADANDDASLARDLLPPEASAQNFWGTPSDPADAPMPPVKPGSADYESPLSPETHRVLMIFTEEGPIMAKDDIDSDDSGDDSTSADEKDGDSVDKDNISTETPVTSTSAPIRVKRNKNPIRYNRRTPKNSRYNY